jgi:hypothetical protein
MTKTGEATTYYEMQKSLEQELELDATADGHDALRLQTKRGAVPTYPKQPANVWTGIDTGSAPRFDIGPDGRPELVPVPTKVKRGER